MLANNYYFNIAICILLALAIIYLTILIEPVLSVLGLALNTIVYPLLVAMVLYYVTRPFREFMESKKIPRIISIILIFIGIYLVISFAIIFLWPYVDEQIVAISKESPKEKLKELENKTIDIMNVFNVTSVPREQLRQTLAFYVSKVVGYFSENFIVTISSITLIASYFIIAPLLLFYFLKDDYKMSADMVKIAPTQYQKKFHEILMDIDSVLAVFISGQILIASIVGVLIYIGYFFIGLNYPLLLASLAFVFNLIPFGGPIISTIPALIIAFSDNMFMAFKVVAVVSIVHLIDLNFISPRVVGKRLNIHPATVIILLIASLSAFGLLSVFLITPLYAIAKTVINDVFFKRATDE